MQVERGLRADVHPNYPEFDPNQDIGL